MIVDCFTFFNELDLLEIRLNMLDKYVDKFVLVESNKTQSLQDKPFIFDESKERFKKFKNKLIPIQYYNPEGIFKNYNDSWNQERAQRGAIMYALEPLNLHPSSDTILISDLDEIPDLNENAFNFQWWRGALPSTIPNLFRAYYLNLQGYNPDGQFKYSDGTVACGWECLKELGIAGVWEKKAIWPKSFDLSGWHFSWLGGAQKVREKSLACIEPFNKESVPSDTEIDSFFHKRVIQDGFFNINDPTDNSVKLVKEPIENLPEYILNNLDKYQKYCY